MRKATIYMTSRMLAATGSPVFASRDRAAEYLPCSKEALADYESGRTVPPCAVVQAMVDAYGDPELRGKHITAECPLIDHYGTQGDGELSRAALGWLVAMGDVSEVGRQLAMVAQDGTIDEHERAAALLIRGKADELRKVMETTIAAIDRQLMR